MEKMIENPMVIPKPWEFSGSDELSVLETCAECGKKLYGGDEYVKLKGDYYCCDCAECGILDEEEYIPDPLDIGYTGCDDTRHE